MKNNLKNNTNKIENVLHKLNKKIDQCCNEKAFDHSNQYIISKPQTIDDTIVQKPIIPENIDISNKTTIPIVSDTTTKSKKIPYNENTIYDTTILSSNIADNIDTPLDISKIKTNDKCVPKTQIKYDNYYPNLLLQKQQKQQKSKIVSTLEHKKIVNDRLKQDGKKLKDTSIIPLSKKCKQYDKGYTCILDYAEKGDKDIYVIFSEFNFDKNDQITIAIGTEKAEERTIKDVEVVDDLRSIEVLRLELDRELEYNHPENTIIRKILTPYNPEDHLSNYKSENIEDVYSSQYQSYHQPNQTILNDKTTKKDNADTLDLQNKSEKNAKENAKDKIANSKNELEQFEKETNDTLITNEILIYIFVLILLYALRMFVM